MDEYSWNCRAVVLPTHRPRAVNVNKAPRPTLYPFVSPCTRLYRVPLDDLVSMSSRIHRGKPRSGSLGTSFGSRTRQATLSTSFSAQ